MFSIKILLNSALSADQILLYFRHIKKYGGAETIFGQKMFESDFVVEKYQVKNISGLKIRDEKKLDKKEVQQQFDLKILNKKMLGLETFGPKKFVPRKNFVSIKILCPKKC